MQNGPITQDWNTVVIRGKSAPKNKGKTETAMKFNGGKNRTDSEVNVRKLESEEGGHLETVSRDLSLMIQQARLAKKLKQSDLAKQCSLPLDKIKNYENGQAQPNNQELQKMSKVLGVTLKKNPKKDNSSEKKDKKDKK